MPEANQSEWSNKIVGKKYVDGVNARSDDSEGTFTRADLPQKSRICAPNTMVTMDYNTERLNVHLDDNNVCTHVTVG